MRGQAPDRPTKRGGRCRWANGAAEPGDGFRKALARVLVAGQSEQGNARRLNVRPDQLAQNESIAIVQAPAGELAIDEDRDAFPSGWLRRAAGRFAGQNRE